MTLYKNKYRIESTRRPGWDYAANGCYFITICTGDRQPFFGTIINGEMHHSPAGELAQTLWYQIPDRFFHVQLDAFVVMPDHIHGIIIIDRPDAPHHDTTDPDASCKDAIDPPTPCKDAINRVSRDTYIDPVPHRDTPIHTPIGGITQHHNPMLSNHSVSKIIRWYKGRCTFEIRQTLSSFRWHTRFHDRIIPNEPALNRVRHYIVNNPKNWKPDRQNRRLSH